MKYKKKKMTKIKIINYKNKKRCLNGNLTGINGHLGHINAKIIRRNLVSEVLKKTLSVTELERFSS